MQVRSKYRCTTSVADLNPNTVFLGHPDSDPVKKPDPDPASTNTPVNLYFLG